MGAFEASRVTGGPLGSAGADPVYPNGAFDPAGMASAPDASAALKVKEIKNGRPAVFSVVGYGMQAFATGKGPVENRPAHIAEPAGPNTILFHDSAHANIAMLNYSGAKDRVTGEHLAISFGPGRKLFVAGSTAPDYLTGVMAGDCGSDILQLGESFP